MFPAEILGPDLIVVIVVAAIVLLFGGSKLPKLARGLGSASHEFKKGLAEGAADADGQHPQAAAPAQQVPPAVQAAPPMQVPPAVQAAPPAPAAAPQVPQPQVQVPQPQVQVPQPQVQPQPQQGEVAQ